MKVFRVGVDVERYQTVVPANEGDWLLPHLDFSCRRHESWPGLDVVTFDTTKTEANFFHLTSGALVFDVEALDAFADLFEMAGEIWPLRDASGRSLFVLNVTECVNAVDEDRSEWRTHPQTGERVSLKRPCFRQGFFSESPLFKIPQTARAQVLTYEGVKSPDDEFKSRYSASGLAGLIFEPVFEST